MFAMFGLGIPEVIIIGLICVVVFVVPVVVVLAVTMSRGASGNDARKRAADKLDKLADELEAEEKRGAGKTEPDARIKEE